MFAQIVALSAPLCDFIPMSFEGAVSSLGKTRDADGTVDRVQDPSQKLWAVLAAFKYKCEVENIEIISIFEVRVTCHPSPWPTGV